MSMNEITMGMSVTTCEGRYQTAKSYQCIVSLAERWLDRFDGYREESA